MATPSLRLWPGWTPGIAEFDGRKVFVPTVIAESLFCAVLCVPSVSAFTGVPWPWILGLLAVHCAAGYVASFPLHARSRTSPGAFHALIAVDLVFNVAGGLALVSISGDPRSPFWLGLAVYAAARGASRDLEPSLSYLGVLGLAPLLAIPFLFRAGAPTVEAVGAPVLVGLFAAILYLILAMNSLVWRSERAAQNAELERLRARATELERAQLARELHDSVGSTLALFRLYADLIAAQLRDPERLSLLARSMQEAAQDGLSDLRGLLDALAPSRGVLGEVAEALRRIGDRFALSAAVSVEVEVSGDLATEVDGPVRVALVRVMQETLQNAVRHGKAAEVAVRLSAGPDATVLEVRDDGTGFDEAEIDAGRGLAGMRARAAELGGLLELESARGTGTRVTFSIPRAGALEVA